MSYCLYYQAQVKKSECWFFTAIFRSFEHVMFDRTIDTDRSIFEFFVPPATEHIFLHLIHYFEREGIVTDLQKLPNPLM